MKKFLTLSLLTLAALAMVSAPVLACGEDKATEAKQASATTVEKSSCSADASGTSAKLASAEGKTCSAEEMKACAAAMGMTVEQCQAMCADHKMSMRTVSIKGMTCTGCEQSLTKAVAALPGVNHVVSISYKDEKAVVCVDPSKCTDENLIKAVANKGYEAQIIPAVAKTTDASTKTAGATCSKTCTAAEKAAFEAKAKETKATNISAEGTK